MKRELPVLAFQTVTEEISPGVFVRVSDSILDTVVFLGHATDAPGKGGIECVGIAANPHITDMEELGMR